MRIFIAGGTGVLGRRIVPRIIAQGHDITMLSRTRERAHALMSLGAAVSIGDALDREAVLRAVTDAQPDLIMHQLTDLSSGSTRANASLRINATSNLVHSAKANRVPGFVLQSIAWAYKPGDAPADEQTPLDNVTTEASRRLTVDAVIAMEQAVRELPQAVILRNGMLYGPDTWYSPEGAMASAARRGELRADQNVTSFVHVEDAAAASIAAISWPPGTFNIVDDDPAAGTEWVPVFCDAVEAPSPTRSLAPRHPWARGADNHHARSLKWVPAFPTWRTGMRHGLKPARSQRARP